MYDVINTTHISTNGYTGRIRLLSLEKKWTQSSQQCPLESTTDKYVDRCAFHLPNAGGVVLK